MKLLLFLFFLVTNPVFGQITSMVHPSSKIISKSTPFFGSKGPDKFKAEAVVVSMLIDPKNNDTSYAMLINSFTNVLAGGQPKGGQIYFEDGSVLSFSEEDVTYNSHPSGVGFVGTCTIKKVNRNDIIMMGSKFIKSVKTYQHERWLFPKESEKIHSNINQLLVEGH